MEFIRAVCPAAIKRARNDGGRAGSNIVRCWAKIALIYSIEDLRTPRRFLRVGDQYTSPSSAFRLSGICSAAFGDSSSM